MSPVFIQSEAELRSLIRQPPSTVLSKIDAGPIRQTPAEFVAATRLAFVTTVAANGTHRVLVSGGQPGFVSPDADGNLLIPIADDRRSEIADATAAHGFAGLLLTVPGIRHTLRVNGTATLRDDGAVLEVKPDQSYAHCAKAFIRSELWNGADPSRSAEHSEPEVSDNLGDACVEFVRRSPFGVLATSLIDGDADLSPRGDPPGFVQVIDDTTLFLPDRPGNRIADSLRNIIANPRASLLLLVPGDARSLEIVGDAHITTDEALCRSSTVNGKEPKLGIVIDVHASKLRTEPALDAADSWTRSRHATEATVPTIGAIVANPDGKSAKASRLKAAATDRIVDLDYRMKLY